MHEPTTPETERAAAILIRELHVQHGEIVIRVYDGQAVSISDRRDRRIGEGNRMRAAKEPIDR